MRGVWCTQIVQDSPFLTMDLLESCFPYALLRTSYHHVYRYAESLWLNYSTNDSVARVTRLCLSVCLSVTFIVHEWCIYDGSRYLPMQWTLSLSVCLSVSFYSVCLLYAQGDIDVSCFSCNTRHRVFLVSIISVACELFLWPRCDRKSC